MLTMEASNNISQVGDRITLIGKMFDNEIKGRNIDFYDGSTYIGTGPTNSNGVGAFTYTCTGAGKKNFVAKWGSLQSEPYTVHDCIKYDKGNTANTIWTTGNNNNAQLDLVDNSYRKLSEITSGTDAWVYLKIDHQCALEFDVKLVSTDYSKPFYQFGQSANATTRSENNLLADLQNGDWHHIKIELNNGSVFVSSPETSTTKSYSLTNYDATIDMYFRFRTLSNVTEISFKEFEYYPI